MNKIYTTLLLLVLSLASCKNADELKKVIYFTGTEISATSKISVDGPTDLGVTITASAIAEADMNIVIKTSPELVETYNESERTNYSALPEGSYNLSETSVKIKKGENISSAVNFAITSLDDFQDGVTYCMPIEIVSTDGEYPILESSRVMYLVISRTIITYAAQLSGTSFRVPFDKDPSLKNVKALTLETRVYVDRFQSGNPFISSVMGIEENFLMRFGDVTIDKSQLQLAGGGYQVTSTNNFAVKKWYHVALVYDGSKIILYVDGKLNSQKDAPRGDIDLTDPTGFYIGTSCNGRYLYGAVSEMRVWTKALTQFDLRNNLCYVDPTSEGLLAYWRFNEGSGTSVKDWTGHGWDLSSYRITWKDAVRCPE